MALPFRKKPEDLSEAERNKRLIRELIVKGILTFMVGITVLYVVISSIVGAGIFVPSTAHEVLADVHEGDHYAWTSETARKVNLGNTVIREDAFRSAVVDLKLNRFQALTLGTLPDKTVYSSDSRLTLYLTDSLQNEGGTGWRLATDFCNNGPNIPANTLAMPSVKEIQAAQPRIVTDQGAVTGQRAWVLSFKPTAEIFDHLLWLSFFDQATKADSSLRDWVISPEERLAIKDGQIKVQDASVWITRDKPREIVEMLIDFTTTIPNGSTWRILVRHAPGQLTNSSHPLEKSNLGKIDCNLVKQEQALQNPPNPTVPISPAPPSLTQNTSPTSSPSSPAPTNPVAPVKRRANKRRANKHAGKKIGAGSYLP